VVPQFVFAYASRAELRASKTAFEERSVACRSDRRWVAMEQRFTPGLAGRVADGLGSRDRSGVQRGDAAGGDGEVDVRFKASVCVDVPLASAARTLRRAAKGRQHAQQTGRSALRALSAGVARRHSHCAARRGTMTRVASAGRSRRSGTLRGALRDEHSAVGQGSQAAQERRAL